MSWLVVYVIAMQSKKLLLPSTENAEENKEEQKGNEEEADLSVEDSIFFSIFLILFSVVFMTVCFASKNRWYMRGILKMLF